MSRTHDDERLRILRMVEEGKLTPEDAARLLEALKEADDTPPSPTAAAPGHKARWLRIRVTEGDGTRVNVNLPVGLVKAALKVAQRYGGLDETAAGDIMRALEEAIAAGESGRIVEVMDQEDGDRVEIYLE